MKGGIQGAKGSGAAAPAAGRKGVIHDAALLEQRCLQKGKFTL
jgi:hypothetical protein